ncbi:AAA family ATPase [Falsiroseomonas sp. HC035]|uniref:nSTAND1 domain-containing NTPase n=1 Tax=Falsiroseomonas sp. HC035 TaxID=3390999 RepID=UPI003D315CB5
MTAQRSIRIFISSPSDVRSERLLAERVILRLAREFAYQFKVEPILWEREPLLATHHFQDLILPPSQADIVVTVLWSRLGVPLPVDRFRGAKSLGPVTGTEWEFEDAVAGFERAGLPDLLLYRKCTRVTVELGDRAVLEEQQRQTELVDAFMRRWFRAAEGGAFTAASWEFAGSAEFEALLEEHLRALLRRRLTGPADIETPATITWTQGSPYRGLESFELDHSQIFFGRTRARNEVREALERRIAQGTTFVAVMGASGSGKSSLVKAALLPDLLLPGMVGRVALCRYVITRPGAAADPIAGLAQALLTPNALPELAQPPLGYGAASLQRLLDAAPAEAAQPIRQGLSAAGRGAGLTELGEARLVLIVDQLEELFTSGIAPAASARYAAALEALAQSGIVWVFATMRSDFFGRLASNPVLAALCAGEGTYVLTPPDGGEIGQIIRRPAREAGLRFEVEERTGETLDDAIREAAARNPGALPLLSYLLDQLWNRRGDHGMLRFADYEALGGLEGAIGRRAEEVLSALPLPVQAAFPAVLRALVVVDGASGAPAARAAPLSRFPEGSEARRLVDALTAPQARILVVEGDEGGVRVRVAHEALLTHWDRARERITEDRRDLRARARLEEAESRWREAAQTDRPSLLLAPGLPLSEAEDLVLRRGEEIDASLRAFVEASSRTAQGTRRRRARIRAAVMASLAIAAVLSSGLAWVSWRNWQEAGRANQVAATVQTIARHTAEGAPMPQRSLLLAVHSANIATRAGVGHPLDTLDEVRRQLRAAGGEPLAGHEGRVTTAAISADGRLLATGGEDGVVQIRRLDGPDPVAPPLTAGRHDGAVRALAFSPDGAWLATGGEDGTLRLWRPEEGSVTEGPHAAPPELGAVHSVAIHPGGHWLAFGTASGHVCLWAFSAEGFDASPCTEGRHGGTVDSVSFSGGGRWFASAALRSNDKHVHLRDLAATPTPGPPRKLIYNQEQVQYAEDVLTAVALGPDDTRLAAGYGYAAEVWDLTRDTPPSAAMLRAGHGQWVTALTFSPDGRWLASGSIDALGRLWDLSSLAGPNTAPILLHGHTAALSAMRFSPDSAWLATGAADTTALLWDLRTPRALVMRRLVGQDRPIANLALGGAEGARHLVAWGNDATPRLWRIPDTAVDPLVLRDDGTALLSAAVSPDGAWLATAPNDKRRIVLWSLRDPRRPARMLDLPAPAREVAFSPEGRWLAAASNTDPRITLWSLAEPEAAPLTLTAPGPVEYASLQFSPDRRWLLAAVWDEAGSVAFWDLASGPPNARPRHLCRQGPGARAAAWSADGRFAATGGASAHRVWDLGAPDPCEASQSPGPQHDQIVHVALSPDGAWLSTAGFDHRGRLYAIQPGTAPRQRAEAIFNDRVFATAFSPDGRRVAFGSWDGTVQVLDLGGVVGDGAAPHAAALRGHTGRVLSVIFSPDSRWLATTAEDHSVRLWDPAAPRIAPLVLQGHEASVFGATFLPDGRIASHGADGTVRLWHTSLDKLLALACRVAGRQLTAEEVRDFIPDARGGLPCVAP